MSGAIQTVWRVKEIKEDHYIVRDVEVPGFYISGPFPHDHTRFATYGQALAAIGHALDKEWDKIRALRGERSPLRWVEVLFSLRKAGGVAVVLGLTERDRMGRTLETYHVLWRGSQTIAADRDGAIRAATALVEDATRALNGGADKPEAADELNSSQTGISI